MQAVQAMETSLLTAGNHCGPRHSEAEGLCREELPLGRSIAPKGSFVGARELWRAR